jgi:agmatine/peptidylarginine deiminase
MRRFLAEFEKQSYTQIIFPHPQTDWAEYLDEAQRCFVRIIQTIQRFQDVLIICHDINAVKSHFHNLSHLHFVEYLTDDTWARDCSALTIEHNHTQELLDFTFNGWGQKFVAERDNQLTQYLTPQAKKINFVLEGGGVESNGEGLLITTTQCMCNPNRNPTLSQEEITNKLYEYFGVTEVLYLYHGYLAGDDTDSHIDTLVRFISLDTLVYVQCKDAEDQHYQQLKKMEQELQVFAKKFHLTLLALPLPQAIYYDGERLPATYANFLFVNGGVLVPTYGVEEDQEALDIFRTYFQNSREVIGVDCSVLIRQHGSLHCVTMQFHSLLSSTRVDLLEGVYR